MRLFELIFLVTLSLSVIILLVSSRSRQSQTRPLPAVFSFLPFLLPVVFILHFFLESMRWQMVPAYAMGIIVMLVSVFHISRKKKGQRIFFTNRKKHPRVFPVVLLFFILVCCALVPAVFPVFTLPPLSGKYRVGTTWATVKDSARPETQTDIPDDTRTLALKIWYPSRQEKKLVQDPYWPGSGQIGRALAEVMDLPQFSFSHFSLVKTGSYTDAVIAGDSERFPVIITLYGGSCTEYISDTEVLSGELASCGYIVIGIVHPYAGLPVIYPDGTIVSSPESRIRAIKEQSHLSDAFWKTYFSRTDDQKDELLKKISDIDSMKIAEIKVRSDDVLSVLDWIALADGGKIPSVLNNRCDLEKIGCIGIRLGGSTAFNVFSNDARIKACINLDGFHYISPGDKKIAKPYLFISSEMSRLSGLAVMKKSLSPPSRFITIRDTTPGSFTGFPFYSPLFDLFGVYGRLPQKKTGEIVRTYACAFFSAYLLKDDQLLRQTDAAPFPGVEMMAIE